MDQEKAKQLFENGAIFVFLDVPHNIIFGIDYNCWRTGEKFKGVKMIPPGIHYIYFNAIDQTAKASIGDRTGFFHCFKRNEIVVKKWNNQTETLDTEYVCDEQELERFRANRHDMDRYLGAYPYESFSTWHSLSSQITESYVSMLVPENRLITSSVNLVGQPFKSSSSSSSKKVESAAEPMVEEEEDEEEKVKPFDDYFRVPRSLREAEQMLPKLTEEKGTNVRFSRYEAKYPLNSNAADITRHSMDLSYRINQLLDERRNNDSRQSIGNDFVLCELQFAFLLFLIGNCYEAFEQWKFLVHLLCNSETFVKENRVVYEKLLNVLYFQLKEMPDDFFTDLSTQNNFLCMNLHNLFANIADLNDDDGTTSSFRSLKKRASEFKEYLTQKFSFDFDDEPDEYAPVVVELPDSDVNEL